MYTLHLGNSMSVLPTLPANSIDSIVCDPPYEISFMSRSWDNTGIAYSVELWREALRVLKPGGHLLAFSGSRTYHRMTCAIEDAGFEIRDRILYVNGDGEVEEHFPVWVYASGFPKSFNLDRERGKTICGCREGTDENIQQQNLPDLSDNLGAQGQIPSGEESDVFADLPPGDTESDGGDETQARQSARGEDTSNMCGLRNGILAEQEAHYASHPSGMQLPVQRGTAGSRVGETRAQGASGTQDNHRDVRGGQPSMEGRRDDFQKEGQLCEHQVSASAGTLESDGTQRRVPDGTQASNGRMVQKTPDENGSGAPHRPQPTEQQKGKSRIVAEQPKPQTSGAWPLCGGCGKPVIPRGLGTSLKPAHEPICVARKPLTKGLTVAANVLAHGTGAINIDGCRVGTSKDVPTSVSRTSQWFGENGETGEESGHNPNIGRWPANLIHDGSDEVLALFPETHAPGSNGRRGVTGVFENGLGAVEQKPSYTDSGSAARFFYCAKTSKKDRDEGLDGFKDVVVFKGNNEGRDMSNAANHLGGMQSSKGKNIHPTVKPTDLMRYLCRLVTPPGGTVLDPFTGSGSTGKAAMLEEFRFVGIEMDETYHTIAKARIEAACMTLFADMI